MFSSRRLVTLLGVGAASAFAAVILPMAAANAAGDSPVPGWGGTYDSCNGAVCLVMEPLTRASVESDWKYSGIRPWITDWKGDQAYNVQYTANDGTVTDAGSYNIKIEDYWNSLFSSSAYQFGDFVANPDAPEGLNLGDFGDLSGASMYKVTIGDFTNLTLNGVGAHDLNYWVMSYGNTDYTVVTDPNAGISQAYLQIGDAAPQFLWNSMFHDWFAPVPDYLIPNDPFAALDFNPCDYVGGCDVPL